MNALVRRAESTPADASLVVLPVFEGDDSPPDAASQLGPSVTEAIAQAVSTGDVSGRSGESVLLYTGHPGGGPERVLLLGLGTADGLDDEQLRRYAGRAVRAAERVAATSLTLRLVDPIGIGAERLGQAAAEGSLLAAWSFREMKAVVGPEEDAQPPKSVESVELWADVGDPDALARGISAGQAVAEGENFARTLQSRPGNVATPTHLAEEAVAIASEIGMDVDVLGPDDLERERMHALRAVSRGSAEEARLIVLHHRGGAPGAPPLALVGKGLTFDAGGISIKPAKGMEDMKFDMSGGAAVLGAMVALGRMGVAANVVGIVPASENLLSGKALKPGDVIRTRAGKTVEVINTDAEGRLILCDALDYAVTSFSPAAMVDCATLTGSVVVGLGHHAAAVLGNDDGLVEEMRKAGERSGERCWPFPLWEEYRRQLRSTTADMKNIGGRPGGTITAAWFLAEFVRDTPWAHLDIAGTAYGQDPLPYQRKGAYGFPTRLLVEWIRSRTA